MSGFALMRDLHWAEILVSARGTCAEAAEAPRESSSSTVNGVLEVHVQKPEQSKPRRLPVTTTIEGGGPTD
jgi:hypothetical protein